MTCWEEMLFLFHLISRLTLTSGSWISRRRKYSWRISTRSSRRCRRLFTKALQFAATSDERLLKLKSHLYMKSCSHRRRWDIWSYLICDSVLVDMLFLHNPFSSSRQLPLVPMLITLQVLLAFACSLPNLTLSSSTHNLRSIFHPCCSLDESHGQ